MSGERRTGSRRVFMFVANVDWFFISHRLPLAHAVRDLGFSVCVAAIDTGRLRELEEAGFETVALPTTRRGTGLLEQVRLLRFLVKLYRERRPALVHHIAVKPVVYGSLAARALPVMPVVNSIAGFGFAGGSGWRARLIRIPLRVLYLLALRRKRTLTIFQNPEDQAEFVGAGLLPADQARLVRGSGVDPDAFAPVPEPADPPTVLFAARMLWEKGVGDFVEAARRVRADVPDARFVLAGDPDPENPTSVPVDQLQRWHDEGVIEWWRHRTDMPAVLGQANLVVLPTYYREGLPKILLEAAACRRAIVATDIPGCREIVRHGSNGLLVPPRDPAAVAAAVADLLKDPLRRNEMGKAGRAMVINEFTLEATVAQIVAIYEELLAA